MKKIAGKETRTGEVMKKPERFVGNCTVALTAMEYGLLLGKIAGQESTEGEVWAVGAGSTTGFQNTNELKVLKYEAAMKEYNKGKWKQAMEEE